MAELSREDKERIQDGLFRKGLEFESLWKKKVPVYTGQYRQSISTEKDRDGYGVTVGTNVPQARRIEFGLGQGSWPDIGDLRTWVDRVIDPDKDRLDTVTFLVARKIFREGVNEQAPLRSTIREWLSREKAFKRRNTIDR